MTAARRVVASLDAAALITDADLAPYEDAFDGLYAAAQTVATRAALSTAIKHTFGKTPQQLIADANYQAFFAKLQDSIVACLDLPRRSGHRRSRIWCGSRGSPT